MNLVEVSIVIESAHDNEAVKFCREYLDRFGVHAEVKSFSPMADPDTFNDFMNKAHERGIKLFIAAGNASSRMSSSIASRTYLPVIALPLSDPGFSSSENLMAIASLPEGIPVAAVTNPRNAAILAAQILAYQDQHLMDRLRLFKQNGCRFS